jgi:carbon-monoxide dehydrogenase medium subunit
MLARFDYLVPQSVPEAVNALVTTPGGLPLAGGQLLLNAMKADRLVPTLLVDLRRISGLSGVDEPNGGTVRIGALTTFDDLVGSAAFGSGHAALLEAVRATGDPQLRNRATVGGWLATRLVASDLAAAALAAGATITIAGQTGERTVSAETFYGQAGPALAREEIITGLTVPAKPASIRSGYEKLADRASGEPISGVAVEASVTGDGRLDNVRVAVTGATPWPTRLAEAEAALTGSRPPADPSTLPVGPVSRYVDDDRGSAGFRANLTQVLLGRVLSRAIGLS